MEKMYIMFEKFRFKKLSAYDLSAYVMSAVLPLRRILFIQFSLQLLFVFSFNPAICDYFNLFRNFSFLFFFALKFLRPM